MSCCLGKQGSWTYREQLRFAARDVVSALGGFALCAALVLAVPAAALADGEETASKKSSPLGQAVSASRESSASTARSSSSSSSKKGASTLATEKGSSSTSKSGSSGSSSSNYSSMPLGDLKKAVQAKENKLKEAKALLDGLEKRLANVQAQLDQVNSEVGPAQALAERSVRERYKVQRQYGSLVDALLCAEDLDSFIAGVEYIEAASKASVGEVTGLRQEIEGLERQKAQIEEEQASAGERYKLMEADLEKARETRDEAQRKADMVDKSRLRPDGANWKAGKKAFVDEWGPRIDKYLEGSPMAEQGDTFASAAWENRIDPRFSPAISCIESGKGKNCIRPYNAWGWGAADSNPYGLAKEWSSWKEAINAHVKGLAEGYGYSITQKGAKKYCPPNWQLWYSTTVSEMNSI